MNHLIGVLGSYKSSAGAGPPVTSGLRLWLDGADPLGTGVAPANGTSITSWKDKSGNAAHVTSSGTCVYQSSSTSIALTSGSYSNTTISPGTFDSAIFIFAVYRGKGAGSFNPLITRSKATYNIGNPDMYNDQRFYMTGSGSFAVLTSSYNLDNSSISTRSIFAYSLNQSANNISEWTNGIANTLTGTYTLPQNMDTANSFNGIYIGTRGDGVTGAFTGNFSEILIYNTALTTTQRQDIEGYLAQKWGLQTWLPSSHPYYYNSGAVPVISGLRLWLDGADPLATGTAPANGTSITSWKDKSGNSAHATSSGTCVYQSLSKSIALTSASYSNTTISAGTFDSAIFIFAVYKIKGSGTNAGYNPLITRSKATYNIGNPDMFNTSRFYMTGVSTYTSFSSSYNLDNSTSTQNIFAYSMNQSTNNISEWTNGTANTLTGTYTLPQNMDTLNAFNGIYIANRGDGFTGPSTGNLAEILIYNTPLTATQRQEIEGYLGWKWGLQKQLPSNHPYYNQPLTIIPAPTNVLMTIFTAGATTISVSWTAPAVALEVASYTVKFYYNTTATTVGGTVFQTITGVSSGATSQTSSTALVNNTYYYATVTSVNISGRSSYEIVSTNTIQSNPAAPTTVTMGAYTAGNTTISVTWSAVTGASSYTVQFYSNTTATTTGGTLFQTFTGVSSGATSQISSTALVINTYYYASVLTVNSVGSSSERTTSTTILTTVAAPTTATMGAYTAGATTISVSWSAVASASSYTVKFYSNTTATTTGGILFQTITDVSSGATSQSSSTALDANKYYYASVATVNSGVSSSERTTSTTIQTVPTAPTTATMGTYTAGATTISVSWTAVSGISSYTVKFYSNTTATTTGGSLLQTITGVSSGATSQSSSNTLEGNKYYYALVAAINSGGSSSETTTSNTIQTVPAAPATATMGTYTAGNTTISVTWASVTGISSYTVKFYSNSSDTTTGGTLFQTITGVSSGATSQSSSTTLVAATYYYASVAAINSVGSSSERTTSTTIRTNITNTVTSTQRIWVDGADPLGTGTPPANGTAITSWKDKSGNSNHMAASTNGTYSANSLSGFGTITFNNAMYRSALTSVSYYPADVYVVVKVNSLTTAADICGISQVSADSFNSLTFSEYTQSRWHNGSSSFSRTPNTVSTTNETSTNFLIMSWSIANSNFYIYRNGVLLRSTTTYSWSPPASVVFLLGKRIDSGSTGQMVGSIAEVIVYNSQLTTTNRQKVEGYLAWKWNLRTQLETSHPYYNVPP